MNPKPNENKTENQLEKYRIPEPGLVPGNEYKCAACPGNVTIHGVSEKFWDPYPRHRFQLCPKCFEQLYVRGTPEGLAAVEEWFPQAVPLAYRSAEFNTLQVCGAWGSDLASARDKASQWARDVTSGQSKWLYLYSEPGPHGTGCGNGKTFLLWSAFKYVCRRMARLVNYPDTGSVSLPCAVVDIRQLVFDFKSRRATCEPGTIPAFQYPPFANGTQMYPFDEYIAQLARAPYLFVDDLGTGEIRGMLAETYERLLDLRSKAGGSTMFTSNYSPAGLHDRLGARAASRAFRCDCAIVSLRAPDYHMSRNLRGSASNGAQGASRPKATGACARKEAKMQNTSTP